jgi:cell fate regulator YaaT (PSP1 superfamily)
MAELVGIRFQSAGRVYYFDAAGLSFEAGEYVVAETSRGTEMGKVVILPSQMVNRNPAMNETPKPVLRKATEDDFRQSKSRAPKNKKALSVCRELVTKLNLDMKPISAQYNLDSSHVTIFFVAEQRVDFRELVRELSRNLRTNVELRQVGARDETKIIGGLGKCGLPLCCNQFLVSFPPSQSRWPRNRTLRSGQPKHPAIAVVFSAASAMNSNSTNS